MLELTSNLNSFNQNRCSYKNQCCIRKVPSQSIKKRIAVKWPNINGYCHSKIRSKIQLTIFDFTEIGKKVPSYNSSFQERLECDRWECHESFRLEVDEDRSSSLHPYKYNVQLFCSIVVWRNTQSIHNIEWFIQKNSQFPIFSPKKLTSLHCNWALHFSALKNSF